MRLWRLSSARRARDFDGGYGLLYAGRWNSAGRPVTYCATVPSLAALEKRVHVADPGILPPLAMVEYEAPDDLSQRAIELSALPAGWPAREVDTQRLGDGWLDGVASALLLVPSVLLQLERAPERNVVINHRHPRVGEIRIAAIDDFTLDPRLFAT
ncbi:MAG TPA: RES family NAD+ phosphorylase [Steroidobacteraceae bacterium]|nr:RES family NAD+ phosphorylase [Steroidobacteraceae bacterium]